MHRLKLYLKLKKFTFGYNDDETIRPLTVHDDLLQN